MTTINRYLNITYWVALVHKQQEYQQWKLYFQQGMADPSTILFQTSPRHLPCGIGNQQPSSHSPLSQTSWEAGTRGTCGVNTQVLSL